ncbi:TonB-dependent receptor [Microvirga sp. SRT01]|uniref:TonB-dependent receptor n=1 Tax=Sphingomonas longa TaxID=2778730 RepID=A0ABS2DAS5_9SPHN|nr:MULTISPECIES: TonB-dependent receptor [Alphaproteobacteria]MBM6578051.1 TonB-dependent receptor [Sphingomonas sp. BT552]MBR7711092.1 TonB-dependent receptor [Microvirga sp. SRT01]
MTRSALRHVGTPLALLLGTASWPALAQSTSTPPADQSAPTAASSSSATTVPTATTQDGAGNTAPTEINTTDGAAADPSATGNQDIVVTGYRASLQSQANAKKNSIGFTDTIFAEDIGKFPDTNIAESVNRIPGVTISREVTGEGANVAIRGLGTNFTRVLLNGAPVAIASVRFDAQSTNREVDLDLIPTELFTQLTVSKSPIASQLEGGAAGTVNLRSARPFDNPKPYLSYGLQGSKVSTADKWGYRGYALASATFGNFGILVGGAAVKNRFQVNGYETIGFTNPNLTAAQSSSGTRNATGGGNFTIPATVPANAGNGLVPGTVIDQAFLLARNPGATIDQIDNGLLPRLSRPRTEIGERTRYNGLVSLEWRPSDDLHFYVDGMYAKRNTDFDRSAMNWAVRNGAAIPLNTTYDKADCAAGCTVTGGTFANSQFFLEYRPYRDRQDYWGVNPGMEFTVNDSIKGDLQANYTKSNFRRESPTVLVITPPSSGVTVNYTNDGGIPSVTTNVDLNNPASFGWAGGGRVNLNGEERDTETKGIRGSLLFGDEKRFSVRVGAAYDDVSRRITPFDNTNPWQAAICGNNPNVVLPGPNRQPLCDGANLPGSAAPPGYPTYAAYGTGFSAGAPPLVYAGSLIPTAAVGSYLLPGPNGFVTVDWDKFKGATNYDALLAGATETGAGSSGANGGLIREKVTGTFVEANGIFDIGDDDTIRLNGGVRYVRTQQIVGGRTTIPDPRNTRGGVTCPGVSPGFALDGSCYPVQVNFTETNRLYSNFLPSASVAYSFGTKAVARGSISRTLTRPDPNQLLPGASFVQPSADVGTLGNNALNPYISDNLDLGFEYYTGGEGVIAFAAFRKSITGFTVNGLTTVPFSTLEPFGITFGSLTQAQQQALIDRVRGTGVAPEQALIQIQQQVNADGKLKVNGLEFQLTQPLDFLTQYIGVRGFGFQGNLTLIDQKGEGAGAPAIALGVAPTTYTLTGYYEGNGLSTRLTYTYNEGSQGSSLNQNGIPAAAIFGRDYGQLDFSGNLDLGKILGNTYLPTLVVNVINITKEAQSSYFQFSNATFNEYNPGRTLLVGIRGRF